MTDNNILFVGAEGVGKTTAIKALSDNESVETEKFTTDTNETVSVHYGMLKLGKNDELHLYESPGHERFSSIAQQLSEKSIGLVVFIDNSSVEPLNEMLRYMEPYKKFIDLGAFVIGITRHKDNPSPSTHDFHRILKERDLNVPVFSVDVRKKNDIAMIIQALLFSMDAGVSD